MTKVGIQIPKESHILNSLLFSFDHCRVALGEPKVEKGGIVEKDLKATKNECTLFFTIHIIMSAHQNSAIFLARSTYIGSYANTF